VLPVVVLALILASLLLGLERYSSGGHLRPFPVAYGSSSGVSGAGVAAAVNGQANLTG
jgi:hypothetical protein